MTPDELDRLKERMLKRWAERPEVLGELIESLQEEPEDWTDEPPVEATP